jgi:hypothetical protein
MLIRRIKFIRKLLLPVTFTPPARSSRIATLKLSSTPVPQSPYHKIPHIAMKNSVIIVSLLTQLDEIVHRLRRIIGVQFHIDIPEIGLNACVSFDFDPLDHEHVVLFAD